MERAEQLRGERAVARPQVREERRGGRPHRIGRVHEDREEPITAVDLDELHAVAHEHVGHRGGRHALQPVPGRIGERGEVDGPDAACAPARQDAVAELPAGTAHRVEPHPGARLAPRGIELVEPGEIRTTHHIIVGHVRNGSIIIDLAGMW